MSTDVATLDRARRLRDEGVPLTEVAERTGVHVRTQYRRLETAPSERERADDALRRLTLRVVEHAAAVPCVGRREWTHAADAAEVAEAAVACRGCPVLEECHAYAQLEQPRSVVLGGLWWDNGRRPHDAAPVS